MHLPRGRIAQPPSVTIRPLTRDDLGILREPRAPSSVKRFRDSHHRVARLVATGLRPRQIADETGYSLTRIGSLCADPTFQHLVDRYRAKVDEAFVAAQDAFFETATRNMIAAERMLADRISEADELDETLPVKDLIAIVSDRADRFGYGKRSTSVNVNVDFAAQLERAIKRSGKAIPGRAETGVVSRATGPETGPFNGPEIDLQAETVSASNSILGSEPLYPHGFGPREELALPSPPRGPSPKFDAPDPFGSGFVPALPEPAEVLATPPVPQAPPQPFRRRI